MTTAVIGATGHVGSEIVRGLLARGDAVAALVRDPELTGPVAMSWPEALELLSAELREPVTFRVAVERQFLERLVGAGVTAGTAQLLIAREWAILAGENDLHDRHIPETRRPPPAHDDRVPSRAPRGIRLRLTRNPGRPRGASAVRVADDRVGSRGPTLSSAYH